MIGTRLRQARLGAGLSMDELAAKMNYTVTKQAISKYERDKSTPSPEVLVCLAKTLGVKTSYFMQEPKVQIEFIAYRKHSRLPKNEANRLCAKISEHTEHYCWLVSMFPDVEKKKQVLEKMPKPTSIRSLEDVENVAKNIRKTWNIGMDPIENLSETLEEHAAIVMSLEANEHFDGHSAWATIGENTPKIPVLVTNAYMPGDRQRFSLAHELGHLVIEQTGTKQDESAAHRFAAALLVPDETAYKELGRNRSRLEFDELLNLKHKYGMSMQAWLHRAKDLSIVSDSWHKTAQIIFRKKNWHKREPGKQVTPEEPIRFRQLVLRALAEKIISRISADELLPGVVSLGDTSIEKDPLERIKTLAAMSIEKRREILKKSAEVAETLYATDKELTIFTELDGAEDDPPW